MNDYKRKNGRLVDQIREVTVERDFLSNSDGSVLISQGNTRVLCTANIENKCPPIFYFPQNVLALCFLFQLFERSLLRKIVNLCKESSRICPTEYTEVYGTRGARK